ncbi:MAG TPA: GYF domain-containing protein [Pirellulales bacterium]
MSGKWYCLIFGEELGPMSWDDLVAMVARGTLGKLEQVKQGIDAEWLTAEAVPGLFSAAAATDVDDADFDLAPSAPMPETLSPSADDDFDLGPSAKATPPAETDFDLAEQPSTETRPAPPSADDDFDLGPPVKATPSAETDFDLAEQPSTETNRTPSDDDEFEVTPTAPKPDTIASLGDDDFDLSPSGKPASADKADVEAGEQPSAQVEATQSLPSDHANAESAPPHEDLRDRETQPCEEKAKKKSGDGLSASSRRAVVFLGGAVGALAVAYFAYLGIITLAAMRRPNYDEILAGYDQLFQQAQTARSDAAALGNPRATMEFLTRLKTLRGGLRNTAADSADAQLSEAGALLAQLYATAQVAPDSMEAKERGAVESDYRAKMSAVRSRLAK